MDARNGLIAFDETATQDALAIVMTICSRPLPWFGVSSSCFSPRPFLYHSMATAIIFPLQLRFAIRPTRNSIILTLSEGPGQGTYVNGDGFPAFGLCWPFGPFHSRIACPAKRYFLLVCTRSHTHAHSTHIPNDRTSFSSQKRRRQLTTYCHQTSRNSLVVVAAKESTIIVCS